MSAPQLPYFKAPEGLEARIRAALRAPERQDANRRLVHQLQFWKSLALAACFTIATLIAVPIIRGWRADPVAALVDAHVRSLASGHLAQVASSEHHTVKPWFAGKVPFSPPVPDLSADSFTLIGGRIDSVAGHDVAAVVYGRRLHVISVFVWPAHGEAARPRLVTLRGLNVLAWNDADLRIAAVSDLNPDELRQFARVFH